MPDSANHIEEKALSWVARLDRTGEPLQDNAELQSWLSADPRHKGAFVRAMAAWQQLERVSVLTAPQNDQPAPLHRKPKPSNKHWAMGIAACAAALAISIGLAFQTAAPTQLTTVRGEIRRVPLEDGSLLAINTSTKLSVDLAVNQRNIDIEKGEAWVQVASDAARPLVVSAGDVRVRAIGTAFSVRRKEDGAEVLVTEGVVEVWSAKSPSQVRRLTAGHGAFVVADTGRAFAQTSLDEVNRKLAWREGDIVLAGETLNDAVSEFNRYNETQIQVTDASIAQSAWIGRFRTNEPQAFAQAVAITTGASVSYSGKTILIGQATEVLPGG